MGKFNSSVVFYNCNQYIDTAANNLIQQMQEEGYDINSKKLDSGKWDISVKKGNLFKSILGMSTALKISITDVSPNVMVKTNVGIFGKQLIPSAITLFVTWPVIITQVWGLIKQSKLDTHIIELLSQYFTQEIGCEVKYQNLE